MWTGRSAGRGIGIATGKGAVGERRSKMEGQRVKEEQEQGGITDVKEVVGWEGAP